MFGFSALSEAPISATAEAQLPAVVVPVGAIGASPIGVYAIGQASITTGGTGVSDGDASAALVVVNVSSPAPTATAGQSATASADVATISVSAPQGTSSGGALIEVDPSQASQTFVVTVQSTAQGNKYFIDGVQQDSLTLHENGTYRFDTSDYSVSSHPLRFSTTADGTHGGGVEYTEGVTVGSGYVEIVVTPATPDLYYYCQIHSGMGGSITFAVVPSQSPFIIEQVVATGIASVSVTATATSNTVTVTAPPSASIEFYVEEVDGNVTQRKVYSTTPDPVTLTPPSDTVIYERTSDTLYNFFVLRDERIAVAYTENPADTDDMRVKFYHIGTGGELVQKSDFSVTYFSDDLPHKPNLTHRYHAGALYKNGQFYLTLPYQKKTNISTARSLAEARFTYDPTTGTASRVDQDFDDRNVIYDTSLINGPVLTSSITPVEYATIPVQYEAASVRGGSTTKYGRLYWYYISPFSSTTRHYTVWMPDGLTPHDPSLGPVNNGTYNDSVARWSEIAFDRNDIDPSYTVDTSLEIQLLWETASDKTKIAQVRDYTNVSAKELARIEVVVEPLFIPTVIVSDPVVLASVSDTASAGTIPTITVDTPAVTAVGGGGGTANALLTTVTTTAPSSTAQGTAAATPESPVVDVAPPENNNVVSQVTTRDNARLTVTDTYEGFGRFNYEFYDAPNETDYYQVVNKDLSRALNVRTGITRLLLEVLALNADGSVDSVVGSYEDVNLPLTLQSYFFEYTGQATLDVYAFTLTARTSDYVWTIYKSAVNLTTGSIGSWQETTDYDFTGTPPSPDAIFINNIPRYSLPFRGQSPGSGVVRNHVIYLYSQGAVNPYRFDIIDKTGTTQGSYSFSSSNARNNEVLKYVDGTYPNEAVDVAYQNLNDKVPLAIWDGISSEAKQSSLLADVYEEVLRTSLIETNYEGTALGVSLTAPAAGLTVVATADLSPISVTPPLATEDAGTGVTATATGPQVTVVAPASVNVVTSTAQPALPSITVGAPLTTETVVEIPIANPPITVSAPAATLAVTSTASAQLVVVTTTAPQATLSTSSTAAATLVTITVSPAQTSLTLNALIEATLPVVTVTAPETIEVVVEQVALPQVTLTPAEAALSASAVATYALVLLDASAPQANTAAAGNVNTAVVTVSVGVPGVNAVGTTSATASASPPVVTVNPAEPTASGTSSVTAALPQITVGAPLTTETVVEIPLAKPPVIVSAPEPTSTGSASIGAPSSTITVVPPVVTANADTTTNAISGSTSIVAIARLVHAAESNVDGFASVSTGFAEISLVGDVEGSIQTSSQVEATETEVFSVTGDQINGSTAVTGSVRRLKDIAGGAQGSTTLTGDGRIDVVEPASISGSSTASAETELVHGLFASSSGASTLLATARHTEALSASSAGVTSIVGRAFATSDLDPQALSGARTVFVEQPPLRQVGIEVASLRILTVDQSPSRIVKVA